MSSRPFEGRWILVTGANRGIGNACVEELATQGANVIAAARAPQRAWTQRLTQLESQHAVAIHSVQLDLREPQSIASSVQRVNELCVPYGLVNNAAISQVASVRSLNMDSVRELFDTNFFGLVELTKQVLTLMQEERSGSIVNISSAAGTDGFAGQSMYGASKAAALLFTASLAKEAARSGIRVNAVIPGMTDTEMLHNIPAVELAKVEQRIYLRRRGQASEVAKAIAFMLSPTTSMLTGQSLRVDGGMDG